MRIAICSVVIAVVAALLPGILVSAAEADTPGCVSKAEFRRVGHGMTPARVARIFDTRGQLLDGATGGYAQAYKSCAAGGVAVEFGWRRPGSPRLGLITKRWTRHRVVNCVTHDEWRQVWIRKDGTGSGPGTGGTRRRIHGVFGITGRVVDRFHTGPRQRWQIRRYDRCASPKTYTVEYTSLRKGPWHSYWG